MMRASVVIFLGGLALSLGACGGEESNGDGEVQRACSTTLPASSDWQGEPSAATVGDSSGRVDAALVEEFNDFLAGADAPVRTSPCDAARVFVHIDQRQQQQGQSFQVAAEPGDSARAEVEVTLSELGDDSILAERWTLEFEAAEGDGIRLVEAVRAQACQPGRGHSRFSPRPCV